MIVRFHLVIVVCIAAPRSCPAVDVLVLSKDEQAVVALTNEERVKQNLSALKPNLILFRVARRHSVNMAQKGELKHELDGTTPSGRVDDAGYAYRNMAENIAYGTQLTPNDAVKIWMESAPHKANIMNEKLTEIGIGIARAESGDVYYTQVFGTPRPVGRTAGSRGS